MLYLSRRAGQTVELRIPGLDTPVIVEFAGLSRWGSARLGFKADSVVEIDRPEARSQLQIMRARQAADRDGK